MAKVCVLLNGEIKNDSRVIKVINTLSRSNFVDLYYVGGGEDDQSIFNSNVRLFSYAKDNRFLSKIIKHSFFYNEFMFFVPKVLSNRIKYDYIYANDLPTLKPGYYLKKEIGSKLIYDSHEIYIETINQFFSNKSNLVKALLFKMLIFFMRTVGTKAERYYLNKVDVFVTVGDELKKYFEKKYFYKNIKIVMNCPPLSVMPSRIGLKSMLGLTEEKKLFIYQGDLNYGRGLFLMIQSFRYVEERACLLILGSGMIKNELVDEVRRNKLEKKVFFLDKVKHSDLKSYTQGADFGINLLESINLSKKYAVPNKLFEYIHAGIPVISSNMPESESLYKKYNIGKLVKNNVEDVSTKINSILDEDLSQYINNCIDASKEYNWENQEKILLELIN